MALVAALGVLLLRCEAVSGQAYRVAGLPTSTASSNPEPLGALDATMLFIAETPALGAELWRTDGTPGGTRLVLDIRPGPEASFAPTWLQSPQRCSVVLGDSLLFVADDGIAGDELWRTDGTAAGTRRVADVHPGSVGGLDPRSGFALLNDSIYFIADDGEHGREVWSSDGTEEGTSMVADIDAGPGDGAGSELAVVDGRLYFPADDGVHGVELWSSDGSMSGTAMIVDLVAGEDSSAPSGLTASVGRICFVATVDRSGGERRALLATDGIGGTVELSPRFGGNPFGELLDVAGTLFFTVRTGVPGASRLWRSDGSRAGTECISDVGAANLVEVAGVAWFLATDAGGRTALWRSDGSAAGTIPLTTLSEEPFWVLSRLVALHDRAYVLSMEAPDWSRTHSPHDWAYGFTLWGTDGSPSGTSQLASFCCAIDQYGRSRARLAAGADFLFLSGLTHAAGFEPWISDGTAQGTILLADVNDSTGGNRPDRLVPVGDRVGFVMELPSGAEDLWTSDGTEAGTHAIASIHDEATPIQDDPLVASNGRLYFMSCTDEAGCEPWSSDGTDSGTAMLVDLAGGADGSWPRDFAAAGDRVYFSATLPGLDREPFVTDGTMAGTRLVGNLSPESSSARGFTAAAGGIVFATGDPSFRTPWFADESGARPIVDEDGFRPRLVDASNQFVEAGGLAYFRARSSGGPVSLYRSDGTPPGTRAVARLDTGSLDRLMGRSLAGRLVFGGWSSSAGREPWVSDGSESGTWPLGDLRAGRDDSTLLKSSASAVIGETLYFTADDGTHGAELWRTNGTTPGTRLAVDLVAGGYGSNPSDLNEVDGRLFFGASWRRTPPLVGLVESDGTAEGTRVLAALPRRWSDLTRAGNRFFFTAPEPTGGYALWAVPMDADSDGVMLGDDNCPEAANARQEDGDLDGAGDACDACQSSEDADADDVCDADDDCPGVTNRDQEDLDADGVGDACDLDADGDGVSANDGDCDDRDDTAWRAPHDVTNLRVVKDQSGATSLTWDGQDGAVGPAVRYTVIDGPLGPGVMSRADPYVGARCSGTSQSRTSFGRAFSRRAWLLVRAEFGSESPCGNGTFGEPSARRPELDGTSCP